MTNVTLPGTISSALILGVVLVWTYFNSDGGLNGQERGAMHASEPRITLVAGTWTEPCKAAYALMHDVMEAYDDQAEFVSLHSVRDKEAADSLDVSVVPTIIFEDANGLEVGRLKGRISREEVTAYLARMGVELEPGEPLVN